MSDPVRFAGNSTFKPVSAGKEIEATTLVSLGSHRDVTTKPITRASSENTESKPQENNRLKQERSSKMIIDTKVNTFMEDGAASDSAKLRIDSKQQQKNKKMVQSPVNNTLGKNEKILAIDT